VGGLIRIKIRIVVPTDMSIAVIWSKSKPEVEFQYGGRFGELNGMSSQRLVSHCRILSPGEFNVRIPEPRVTLLDCRVLPPSEFNDMIPEPGVTLQGAATWRIQDVTLCLSLRKWVRRLHGKCGKHTINSLMPSTI